MLRSPSFQETAPWRLCEGWAVALVRTHSVTIDHADMPRKEGSGRAQLVSSACVLLGPVGSCVSPPLPHYFRQRSPNPVTQKLAHILPHHLRSVMKHALADKSIPLLSSDTAPGHGQVLVTVLRHPRRATRI